MSSWIEIEENEDVNYDINDDEINVLYGRDDFGNNYISIPLQFIVDALAECGVAVEIDKP